MTVIFFLKLATLSIFQKTTEQGFPGGSVVKNLPANAEDKGSIPGLRRSHMPWSNWTLAPQLLSLCPRAWEPWLLGQVRQLLKAAHSRAHTLQQEKPLQREAHTSN